MYPVASILKAHFPLLSASFPVKFNSTFEPSSLFAHFLNKLSLDFCIVTRAESPAFKPSTMTLKSLCPKTENEKKKNNVISFPGQLSTGEREVEAILFAAAEPLEIETIEDRISKKIDVKKILKKLEDVYKNRGINLVCISNKWSFRTASNLSSLMSKQKTVEKKLSKAAIETLSIIVYHQPVTRAEIEEIRGVAFGTNTLDILMELNWVKPMGRKEIPGKPIQYGTTEDFLSHFNLQKLSDLPTVDELGSAGLIDTSNVDASIFGTGKFFKEKQEDKKENIYTEIDEMLSGTLKNEDDK